MVRQNDEVLSAMKTNMKTNKEFLAIGWLLVAGFCRATSFDEACQFFLSSVNIVSSPDVRIQITVDNTLSMIEINDDETSCRVPKKGERFAIPTESSFKVSSHHDFLSVYSSLGALPQSVTCNAESLFLAPSNTIVFRYVSATEGRQEDNLYVFPPDSATKRTTQHFSSFEWLDNWKHIQTCSLGRHVHFRRNGEGRYRLVLGEKSAYESSMTGQNNTVAMAETDVLNYRSVMELVCILRDQGFRICAELDNKPTMGSIAITSTIDSEQLSALLNRVLDEWRCDLCSDSDILVLRRKAGTLISWKVTIPSSNAFGDELGFMRELGFSQRGIDVVFSKQLDFTSNNAILQESMQPISDVLCRLVSKTGVSFWTLVSSNGKPFRLILSEQDCF